MIVRYSLIIPKHIAQDLGRCKALADRVLPSPLPADFSIRCTSGRGIRLEFSVDHPTAAAAYLGIRKALNLEAPP